MCNKNHNLFLCVDINFQKKKKSAENEKDQTTNYEVMNFRMIEQDRLHFCPL